MVIQMYCDNELKEPDNISTANELLKPILTVVLLLGIVIALVGCAHTDKQGLLQVDTIEGVFNPTISLATAHNPKGEITLQQVVVGRGTGDILASDAATVGAATMFGAVAAPLYKPAQSNTKNSTTVQNGGSNVSNNSGSNATNVNKALATGSSANATGLGGNAAGGLGGTSTSSSSANPVSNASGFGGTSSSTSSSNPITNSAANSDANSSSSSTGGNSTGSFTFSGSGNTGTGNGNNNGGGGCEGNCGNGNGNGGGNGTGNEGNN